MSQYLPLGLFLHQGRLACYQCTYGPHMQQLTADVVEHNRARMQGGNTQILGKGEGSSVLFEGLLRRFEKLQEAKLPPRLVSHLTASGRQTPCSPSWRACDYADKPSHENQGSFANVAAPRL
jgi:hypothetical protein